MAGGAADVPGAKVTLTFGRRDGCANKPAEMAVRLK